MRRTTTSLLLLAAAATLEPAALAGWKLKSKKTAVVSVPAPGVPTGLEASFEPSLSADGRFVCFNSREPALTGHGSYPDTQVLVKDRQTGAVHLISENNSGQPADEKPNAPAKISGSGEFVVWSTRANDLVDGITIADALGHADIFRTHVPTGTTVRVSVTHDVEEPNEECFDPEISHDGRYVTFISTATNLLPGTAPTAMQVYRKDMWTGILERVSVAPNGAPADANCHMPSMSDDGSAIAFRSYANNLGIPKNNSGGPDVWLRDLTNGTNEMISANKQGVASDLGGTQPAISGDGRFVAFRSLSNDLPKGDGTAGVFVRDRKKGKTFRAPLGKTGDAWPDDFSAGRYVALTTDGNAVGFKAYVWDVKKNKVKALGLNSKGKKANAWQLYPAISANGKVVAFQSSATNLGKDQDAAEDVFVRRWK